MGERIFVISDLHIGGEPGFQMVLPSGQARLASFIRSVTSQHRSDLSAHIVLAGDVVDFLAEAPFAAFTPDEDEAARKLARILDDTAVIWEALRAHVQAGAPLTLLLGNHDIELALPAPRRLFLERLTRGNVEFLDDDRAFTRGPLLIEHGNRYDGWNVVDYDGLRRLRAALSRRETATGFAPQPGSEMVAALMNPLKQKYSFIDLLKPETETVPPFLALLEPALLSDLKRLYELARLGRRAQGTRTARDLDALGAGSGPGGPRAPDEAMLALTEELAAPPQESGPEDGSEDGSEESGPPGRSRGFDDLVGFVDLWASARFSKTRSSAMLRKLRKALLAQAGAATQALHTGSEQDSYLNAARDSASRGFEVVIYGHTHLVKRIELGGALYLNTGTWADLMVLPASALDLGAEEAVVLRELEAFAEDLATNQLGRYRTAYPTFACVELAADQRITGADVFRFTKDGESVRVPDGVLQLR